MPLFVLLSILLSSSSHSDCTLVSFLSCMPFSFINNQKMFIGHFLPIVNKFQTLIFPTPLLICFAIDNDQTDILVWQNIQCPLPTFENILYMAFSLQSMIIKQKSWFDRLHNARELTFPNIKCNTSHNLSSQLRRCFRLINVTVHCPLFGWSMSTSALHPNGVISCCGGLTG